MVTSWPPVRSVAHPPDGVQEDMVPLPLLLPPTARHQLVVGQETPIRMLVLGTPWTVHELPFQILAIPLVLALLAKPTAMQKDLLGHEMPLIVIPVPLFCPIG